ncbi:MAG: ATP-binding protein [Chloroflexota bacterium]
MADRNLQVPGRLDQVQRICEFVGQAAASAGLDRRATYACQLAVTEACENIIKHGYAGQAGTITATTRSQPGELAIELEDTAPPFKPAQGPTELSWTQQNPPIGGLGLLIIHRVMDEVTYERRGNKNWLRMVKRSSGLRRASP